jgi:RNA polymerase sigma-70 factor (ECF subfamily)
MTHSSTHVSLLMRVRDKNDGEAWSAFIERYSPLIVSWCTRFGLQSSDAEDVAQSVLLKLTRRMESFSYDPDRGSFRGYLRTLTRYAINDALDDRGPVGSGDTEQNVALYSIEARDDLVASFDPSFDNELLEESLSRVRNRVEPTTWQAFEMTALREMTPVAAAAELEISLASVYKSKSRVLQMLRDELALLDPEKESRERVAAMLGRD